MFVIVFYCNCIISIVFLSNLFGDVITNNDNPYTELSYREKRSVSRNKKYAKKDIDGIYYISYIIY